MVYIQKFSYLFIIKNKTKAKLLKSLCIFGIYLINIFIFFFKLQKFRKKKIQE